MHLLITGSSGQLGRAIARQLGAVHRITGLDLTSGAWTTHVGSVTDRELVFKLAEGIDAIIHTASLHAPHVTQFTKEQFIEVNVQGTLHLLEAALKHKAQGFIYTSTTSLYGAALIPHGRAVWVTEELVPQPRDIYDITKFAAEQLCKAVSNEFGLPCVCLRTSRFWDEPAARRAVYRLYRGIDVRDAASAHALALQNPPAQFEIFNISAQSPFVESDTVELLRDARELVLRYCPEAEAAFARRGWELPKCIDRVYVVAKANSMLGFEPRHNFRELLREEQG